MSRNHQWVPPHKYDPTPGYMQGPCVFGFAGVYEFYLETCTQTNMIVTHLITFNTKYMVDNHPMIFPMGGGVVTIPVRPILGTTMNPENVLYTSLRWPYRALTPRAWTKTVSSEK